MLPHISPVGRGGSRSTCLTAGKLPNALAVLLCLAMAACTDVGGLPSPSPGLHPAKAIESIVAPVDWQVADGSLFVLAGRDSAEIWEVRLDEDSLLPRPIHAVLPPGRGERLEATTQGLLVAGTWGDSVVHVGWPNSQVEVPARVVPRGRDFLGWPDGSLLVAAPPTALGFLVQRSVRIGRRESVSGWGVLPATRHRKVQRASVSPYGDALLALDGGNRVHVAVNRDGLLVQFDSEGTPQLVSWLPQRLVRAGSRHGLVGYGRRPAGLLNGFESGCNETVWASAGAGYQEVTVLDATTYVVVEEWTMRLPRFRDAMWMGCGKFVLGLARGELLVMSTRRDGALHPGS